MNLYRLPSLACVLPRIEKGDKRDYTRLRYLKIWSDLRTSKGSQAVHRARREKERAA